MNTTELILHALTRAQISGEPFEDGVRCCLNLPGNRRQHVKIRPVGKVREGLTIIAFEAGCQRLDGGLLRGLSGAQALRLLEFNSTIPLGAFCIVKRGEEEMLTVRSTQILETCDAEELSTHFLAVAQLADQWEERLQRDDF